MNPIVGLIAQGQMGSGIGRRLVEQGLTVWTVIEGRSEDSARRAAAAGMVAVAREKMAEVDLFLSVVPPAEAEALAQWLSPVLASAKKKAVYADLNAISPESANKIAVIVESTGWTFADGGIIGLPPNEKGSNPAIYVSGPGATRTGELSRFGLDMHVMDAPVGAASALKLCFAGIAKGFTAMTSMMILAASRHGAADDLAREVADKVPHLRAHLSAIMPLMYDKAHRFGPEMLEISDFISDDHAAGDVYRAYGEFYGRLGEDNRGPKAEVKALQAFVAKIAK